MNRYHAFDQVLIHICGLMLIMVIIATIIAIVSVLIRKYGPTKYDWMRTLTLDQVTIFSMFTFLTVVILTLLSMLI